MIRDEHNVIPISLAVLLHVVVFGSLVFALDLSSRVQPITPMAIQGTLVTDMSVVPPAIKLPDPEPEPIVEEQPEFEPEPEPEVEPEPPQPDPAEVARKQAEEQKRLDDARIEQERLQRIRDEEAEKQRKADEARKKREAEEAEKKRLADEVERKRQEEAETIRAGGRRDAQIIEAEADAQAANIYAEAYNQDPGFYDFYRAMQSYRQTFMSGDGESAIIMSPDNEYLRQFRNPGQ